MTNTASLELTALLLLDEKLLKMEAEVGLMDGLPIRAE